MFTRDGQGLGVLGETRTGGLWRRLADRAGRAGEPLGDARGPDAPRTPAFESLEPRTFLSGTALFDVADLEDPTHTVVRLETTLGDIYFELFDDVAPGTVENFLNYVEDGDYLNSFFHRLALNPDNSPFVLQGGGFRVSTSGVVTNVPTDPPIQNEFNRSNVEWTVAMAKIGGDPNSATSQFFINLGDNSFLDTDNGGFTVFGVVLDGASRAVVTEISTLMRRNFQSGTGNSALREVPVLDGTPSNATIDFDIVVNLLDVQEIRFLTVYHPEGYADQGSTETLTLVNTNNFEVDYQVLARYETGVFQSDVARGTLAANSRVEVRLSAPGETALVRTKTPYALEVITAAESATPTDPVAGTLTRRDFSSEVSESFVFAGGFSSSADLRTWDFAAAELDRGRTFPFLTWVNTTGETATITVTFIRASGSPPSVTATLEGFRRGGLKLFRLGDTLPEGNFSVRVESTQPIVAALSQFALQPPASGTAILAGSQQGGFMMIGTPGGGSTSGHLSGVQVPLFDEGTLSFVNAGTAGVVVNIDILTNDPMNPVIERTRLIGPRSRIDLDLRALLITDAGQPEGDLVSVRFDSTAPVAFAYVSGEGDDLSGAAGQSFASSRTIFSDGFTDPATSGFETLSLSNPFFGPGATDQTVTVRFRFVDGTVITLSPIVLSRNERIDLDILDQNAVTTKINTGAQFRFYSIEVSSTAPVLAQLSRVGDADNGEVVTTTGMPIGTFVELNDAQFGA